MKVNMFDVFYVKLPDEKCVSEQGGIRPCVIIQNEAGNLYSPTVIVIPLTTEIKKINQATHCIIHKTDANGLMSDSMALAEQIRVVDKSRLREKLGSLESMKEQNDIINVYLANVTGKKKYIPIWEKVILSIFKLVKEGNSKNDRAA